MPIIKSAKKAARQAVKRTEHNSEIKKSIKAALKAFKANPTPETLAKAQSEYDKAVKKDLIKKNTASRRKAKLHGIAKQSGMKLAAKATKPATKAEPKAEAKVATKSTAKTSSAKKPATKSKAAKK